jgi:hypothetical protein
MRSIATLGLGLSAALSASACADVFKPEPGGGALTTDRPEYVARYVGGSGTLSSYGFTVVARFENPTDSTIYLQRCNRGRPGPIYYVALVNAPRSSESAYLPNWACVGPDIQFAVAPGAVRFDTLELLGPNAWNGYTGQPLGIFEGIMRIGYDLRGRGCPDDVFCRDLEASNTFRVTLAR